MLRLDDHVLIRNCRPLSARKRFTLERIIKSPETEREEAHRRLAEEAHKQFAAQAAESVPQDAQTVELAS